MLQLFTRNSGIPVLSALNCCNPQPNSCTYIIEKQMNNNTFNKFKKYSCIQVQYYIHACELLHFQVNYKFDTFISQGSRPKPFKIQTLIMDYVDNNKLSYKCCTAC